ncbi:MAG TPA: acyl--CoA ligase [Mycobacteriales bacterium]|nr:acyl--CoA ligase [Mycobacteriales bacterium]
MSETGALLDLLQRRDDAPALIDAASGQRLSHRGLREEVQRVADQLAGLGVGAGDRVGMVLANSPRLVVAFLAIVSLGAAVAPLNPAFSAGEVRGELEDLKVGFLLYGEPATGAATEAASQLGIPHAELTDVGGHVVIDGATPVASTPQTDGNAIALLLHTSGTTSRPKTVPLAQRNLARSARNVAATYQLGPDDVCYCVMPLFHIHGLVAAVLASLSAGGSIVIPPRFSAGEFWPNVKDYGATWYTAVPTIHHIVLQTCADERHVGHKLRFVRSCSATLPPPLWREFESVIGVPLVEAYGMTEASHQMASNPLPPGERRPGSVGQATGIEVAILDDDWRPVAPGISGEVSVKGASVVDGYLDNPEANAASFRDGWFRTGDVGVLSDDGYLTLVGRIKEIINRGGEKISPYEVEAVLLEHPAVAEAAAYGAPDDKYGERVEAVVVPKSDVTAAELTAHCASHLVGFKVPASIAIRDAIPKGPTGKIQRRLLADLVNS